MQGQECFKGLSVKKEKEVVTIMMRLFDEEQIMRSFIKSEKYDLAREKATLMLRDGKITIDEVSLYFPELFESDIKELEEEIVQLV